MKINKRFLHTVHKNQVFRKCRSQVFSRATNWLCEAEDLIALPRWTPNDNRSAPGGGGEGESRSVHNTFREQFTNKAISNLVHCWLSPAPAHWNRATLWHTSHGVFMGLSFFVLAGFLCLTPNPYQQIRGKRWGKKKLCVCVCVYICATWIPPHPLPPPQPIIVGKSMMWVWTFIIQ